MYFDQRIGALHAVLWGPIAEQFKSSNDFGRGQGDLSVLSWLIILDRKYKLTSLDYILD